MICVFNWLSIKCDFDSGKAVARLPVNVRPNTSSSGGRICLGVVVLVIDSAPGFISGKRAIFSSCDCMLYGLRRCHCGIKFGNRHGLRTVKQDLDARITVPRTMAMKIMLTALRCGSFCRVHRTE